MADTKDLKIGKGCEKDVQIMRERMEAIASGISYRQSIIVLAGSDFSKEKLYSALEEIDSQPMDIVFFYYSGHGYKHNTRKGGFPVMHIEKRDKNGLNPPLDSLHMLLCKKKSRLTITLGDCCNDSLGNGLRDRGVPVAKTLSPTSDFYRKLFLDVKGNLLICSAIQLQVAVTDLAKGSVYTRAFREALCYGESYNTKRVTWDQFLKDADNRMGSIRLTYPVLNGRAQFSKWDVDSVKSIHVEDSGIAANLTYDRVNRYLNILVDRGATEKERKYHSHMWTDYFTEDAMVDVYVNTTLVEKRPVRNVIEQMYLNATTIAQVNFISDLSSVSADGTRYTRIAIQQIRR